MNIQEMFRMVMGLNPRHPSGLNEDPVNRFKNPPWGDDPDEDDEFDELYTDYRRRGPGADSGFNIFAGDAMDIHRYFEQQMNDMIRSFGMFGLQAFDDQGLPQLPESEGMRKPGSPRDRYLKPHLGEESGTSTSQARTDSDLDHRISREGISALFKKEPEESSVQRFEQNVLQPHSQKHFKSFFSSKTIFINGAVVEEKVEERNSNGSESQTVTRRLGDESHSVTVTKDSSGEVVQHEELVNIDKDSLGDFNNKWSRRLYDRSRGGYLPGDFTPSDTTSDMTPVHPYSSGSLLSSLWRLFS